MRFFLLKRENTLKTNSNRPISYLFWSIRRNNTKYHRNNYDWGYEICNMDISASRYRIPKIYLMSKKTALIEAGAKKIFKEYTGNFSHRPIFENLLQSLQRGDEIIVTRLSNFARSYEELTSQILLLSDKNITINIWGIGRLDNSPFGELYDIYGFGLRGCMH